MIIDTDRLCLRPVTEADVDDLVRLDSDPQVMRYVSGGAATAREIVEDWVLPRAQSEWRAHTGGLWVATHRGPREHETDPGDFIGWLSLRKPRHSTWPEVELSYRFARSAWGRGLATEGATALIMHSFVHLRTERIFASTTAANIGSRRVMEKAGMRVVSVAMPGPADDADPDSAEVEYELLRSQWESSRLAPRPTHSRSPRARHRSRPGDAFGLMTTEAG